MGQCLATQTTPSGKPDHLRQEAEAYSNDSTYFTHQVVSLITHEFHDQPPETTDTLLLTYMYFTNSNDLFEAIRERFFIKYETYSFTTYEQEKFIAKPPPLPEPQPSASAQNLSDSPKSSVSTAPTADSNTNEEKKSNHESNAMNTETGENIAPFTKERSNSVDRNIVYIPTKKLPKSEWIKEVKIPIQRKCLDFLLEWIEKYWKEDFNNNELFENLKQFTTEIKQKRDNVMNNDIILDDEHKNDNKTKRNRKETEEMNKIELKYSSFLQEYIFQLENIVNTQQEWYKNVMVDLKQKQIVQQNLLQEQIKKSQMHHRNLRDPTENDAKNGGNSARHSRRNTQTYTDNLLQIDLVPPVDNDAFDESNITNNDNEQKSNHRVSYSNFQQEENLANSLLFITVKNRHNAIEYAKQLTLLDWESFKHITPREFLAKVMQKKQTEKWVQLKLFIDRFQQTHQYVLVSIIAAKDLTARVEMIDFFIFVAESLLKLNNLYSFMAVCTALDSISVSKLKVAWEFVSKSNKRKFSSFLSPLCSGKKNYKGLRDYCSKIKPPGIPFLGIILQDITFTNDGNKDKLSKREDQQINFRKYRLLNKICKTITIMQDGSYSKLDQHCKALYDEDDIHFLEKRVSAIERISGIEIHGDVISKEMMMSDSEYISDGDYLSDNDGDNQSREPSKSKSQLSHTATNNKETSKSGGTNYLSVISSISTNTNTNGQQFGISNIDGNEFNLIHDYALQDAILKDFNSYILLNKNVIRAMTIDANRLDQQMKEQYISDNYNTGNASREPSVSKSRSGLFAMLHNNRDDDNNNDDKKKEKSIFKIFKKRKSKSVNEKEKNKPIEELDEGV